MPETNTMPESNTNTMDIQKVWNFDLGTLIRREELNGRQYIVVPMVMILEGVHVGSQGPVYYSLDELAKTPKQWNMKPIVIEHPFRGDTATDLEVYKKQAVGMIMNTHFVDGKLKAEAWIDEQLAQEKCPELIQHIEHRLPMEVSTGLFSELVMESGTWNGEEYKGKIINIRADHLAILPKKQGACSLSDGAGLLINQSYANEDSNTKGDTLNIISKVINQTFPPGSNVVMDYDLDVETGKKQPEEVEKEKQEKETQDKKTEEKKKEKIENAIKPEVFMTADGNKITYEAAGNGTLEIEKPDFGSADEKKEEPEEVKVEPIQDNPVNVDVKPRIGRSDFEELLADLAVKAERVKSCQERYVREIKNKSRKPLYNAQGGIQSTKGTFRTLTQDTLDWRGEVKSLTDSLINIESGLVGMYEEFHKQLEEVGIKEEDIPFNLVGFERFLDYIRLYKSKLAEMEQEIPGYIPPREFKKRGIEGVNYELASYLDSLTQEELDEMSAFVEHLYNYEKSAVSDSMELMQYLMSNQKARTDDEHRAYEDLRENTKASRAKARKELTAGDTEGNRGSNKKSFIPPKYARSEMIGDRLNEVFDPNLNKVYSPGMEGESELNVEKLGLSLSDLMDMGAINYYDLNDRNELAKAKQEARMIIEKYNKKVAKDNNFKRFVMDLIRACSAISKALIFADDEVKRDMLDTLETILDTYGLDVYYPELRISAEKHRAQLEATGTGINQN